MNKTLEKKFVKKGNKRVKSNGFTLVELLAVLALLSVVITGVIYTFTNIIENAKEKSYNVTVSNIEKEAGSYILENENSLSWIKYDNSLQYQCVTVQQLIDKGFFKGDVLESYVDDDILVSPDNYIYLERDSSNKHITRTVLLYGEYIEKYGSLCNSIQAEGHINFNVEPSGWARKKEVTIYYTLNDTLDKVSNYVNDYYFDQDIKGNDNFNNLVMTKKVIVDKIGTLLASIKDKDNNSIYNDSVSITKIDNIRPVITDNYNGSSIVRKSVTIPIELIDNESGIDGSSFTVGDVNVSIGDNDIKDFVLVKINDNNYLLTINDLVHDGRVKLTIAEGNVLDNVGNKNEEIIWEPVVSFSNKYKISYNGNGGEVSEEFKEVVYNTVVGELATATRVGYNFISWNTKADGSGIVYDSSSVFTETNDIVLYAQWEINTYAVRYDANGGSGAPSNQTKKHGMNLTLSNEEPKKSNYIFAGWNTEPDGTGTSYASGGTYAKDADLILYAQWDFKTYTVRYDANGGSGAPSSQTKKHGMNLTLSSEEPKKSGYTFTGWNTEPDGTGTSYASGETYAKDADLILYAQWRKNKVYIKYSVNGGTVDSSTTSKSGEVYSWTTDSDGIVYKNGSILRSEIDYGGSTSDDGLANWNNSKYLNITRENHAVHTGNEWKCLEGCTVSNKLFADDVKYNADDFCDASGGDCTVVVGINWYNVTPQITNGSWWIWAKPGIVWGTVDKNVWVYTETSSSKINVGNNKKDYMVGVWESGVTAYIRMSEDTYIYEEDVRNYKNDTRTFVRVWIRKKHIGSDGYGCVGSGYAVGKCQGNLQSLEINGEIYWSVWVPWKCGNYNCPRTEVSIKAFPNSPPF